MLFFSNVVCLLEDLQWNIKFLIIKNAEHKKNFVFVFFSCDFLYFFCLFLFIEIYSSSRRVIVSRTGLGK